MFYTYIHLEGREVVYVGSGKKNRQFARNYLRSDEHAEWIALMLEKVGQSYSKVIKYFSEESDARYFEKLMIKKYQPKFNKMHTKDFKRPDVSEMNKEMNAKRVGDKNPMFGKPGYWLGKKREKSPTFGKRWKSPKLSKQRKGQDNPGSMTNKIKRQKTLEKVTGVKWYFKIMNPNKYWKGGRKC